MLRLLPASSAISTRPGAVPVLGRKTAAIPVWVNKKEGKYKITRHGYKEGYIHGYLHRCVCVCKWMLGRKAAAIPVWVSTGES